MTEGATDVGAALQAAMASGTVAHLPGGTYTVSAPIVINVAGTLQGPMGIDLGGGRIVSQITDGSPVIRIVVGPGVDLRYLTLSNFTIEGNGREGAGISIEADGNDRWVYSWAIDNVTVAHVGGYGLDVRGSVFEGTIVNSWMIADAAGGAYFSHSGNGGQVSAIRWFGGGFRDNGSAGLILDNGARDVSVDGASFTNNNGVGISAGQGISSVTSSFFQDNRGAGVWFQNFGNFDHDTFSTSGAQPVGITGYLVGNATVSNNASFYTGPGADPTVLANLQGSGGAFVAGDVGRIVTGSNVLVGGVGGANSVHATVGTDSVPLPALLAVTAATTAPAAASTGTGAVEAALKAALASGSIVRLTESSYVATSSIVINVGATLGSFGIDLGGAKILSQIAGGAPVIEIAAGAGVNLGALTLANFTILGNGQEGDGIKIVADGSDRSICDLEVRNVSVEHVGGIGLDVLGSVQGNVFNTWMHGNAQGGARFANSAGGGISGEWDWMGGGFRKNGTAGLMLDNGAHDMSVRGAYFVENNGPGLAATSGITLVEQSGFENNQGTGAVVHGAASFVYDGFSTWGTQRVGIGGSLAGGEITLIGVGEEYYGPGADPVLLANVQGNGRLSITASSGNVMLGPNVSLTDAPPGGPGNGTSVYAGASSNYKVTLSAGSSVVTVQDKVGSGGTDTLTSIQKLQFSDQTTDLSWFIKSASLSAAQLGSLVEVYIASFNRAPDALGLAYWGSRLKDGMGLQDIAKSFFVQPEAAAFYPAGQSTQSFVSSVYDNVLDRGPDAAGLAYWADGLQSGGVSKDSFLLAIINGAKSFPGSIDVQTLANKAAVGAHFALTEGLSNLEWAKAVMAGVGGTANSAAAANSLTEGFAQTAESPGTSEFVVQIVGIAL